MNKLEDHNKNAQIICDLLQKIYSTLKNEDEFQKWISYMISLEWNPKIVEIFLQFNYFDLYSVSNKLHYYSNGLSDGGIIQYLSNNLLKFKEDAESFFN